jgi:hypothetical protein
MVQSYWLCGRLGGKFLALWWAWLKMIGFVVGMVQYSWCKILGSVVGVVKVALALW